MLLTLWFYVNLFAVTFWYAGKAALAGLLGVRNRPGGVYDECARRWGKRLVSAAHVPVRLAGFDRVPPQGAPVVFASNHQSWFDIFLLLALLPTQVRFVAKQELERIPFLGRAMRAAGHIFIDRQNRQAAFGAYETAAAAIRAGMSAIVFPEGTRSRTGELLPFKKGPFVLAIAAQVPIIPVYCAGTFTLKAKGRWTLTPHPVAVLFGEPIATTGLGYDDREGLSQRTHAAIERLRVDASRVLG
jgi:1-acyl-sn-glycerol-3-phosphate acyltransferase